VDPHKSSLYLQKEPSRALFADLEIYLKPVEQTLWRDTTPTTKAYRAVSRPYYCTTKLHKQKSPRNPQKSPIYPQKSPIYPQKSLIHPLKEPYHGLITVIKNRALSEFQIAFIVCSLRRKEPAHPQRSPLNRFSPITVPARAPNGPHPSHPM